MDYAIELENVTRRFGPTIAVDGLTLRLEPGVFLGLLGRNGAGKTTTINMCTGLLKPSSGSIRVLGINVQEHALAAKQRMGVMAQDEGFLDSLTGSQYLYFVGRVYGLDENQIGKRSQELFETLELAPEPGALVREYSYGMKKKLALCAALIHGPVLGRPSGDSAPPALRSWLPQGLAMSSLSASPEPSTRRAELICLCTSPGSLRCSCLCLEPD